MSYLGLLLSLWFLSNITIARTQGDFSSSKKYLSSHLDLFDSKTIYCSCNVVGKAVDLKSCGYQIQSDAERAKRLEWEHVVPAEAFGNAFVEWREGSAKCQRKGKAYKGRKCAEKNEEFKAMEGDLYNLFPEIGELNGLRSNFSMAQISSKKERFGSCAVKLEDRKFEPQDLSKGIVARTYLNFDKRYPGKGVVSEKNRPLFEAWHKMYPVTELECRRWNMLEQKQGYRHLFADSCSGFSRSTASNPMPALGNTDDPSYKGKSLPTTDVKNPGRSTESGE